MIVDRIWTHRLSFSNLESAVRWIKGAAQGVHQGVLDRNTNGARDNPVYNVP